MVWAAWNGILPMRSVPGNIIHVRSLESWLPQVVHTSFTKGLDSGPPISLIIDSKGDGTLVFVVRALFLNAVSASLFPFLTLSFSTSWWRAKRRCSASVSSSIKPYWNCFIVSSIFKFLFWVLESVGPYSQIFYFLPNTTSLIPEKKTSSSLTVAEWMPDSGWWLSALRTCLSRSLFTYWLSLSVLVLYI